MSEAKTEDEKKKLPSMTPDLFFKQCMKNSALARDFMVHHLPAAVKDQIRLETLEVAPEEYLTSALRKKLADVVYKVKLKKKEGAGFLIVHVECQTKPLRLMLLRMLEFMTTIMRQYAEGQKYEDSAKLPVVYPIIVSNHGSNYPYSTRFLDLFNGVNQEIMYQLLNAPLPLIDLEDVPDTELKRHARASLMEMALKHVKNAGFGEGLKLMVVLLKELVLTGDVSGDEAGDYLEKLIFFLVDNVRDIPADAGEIEYLLAEAGRALPDEAKGKLMTLREYFEQSGLQRGLAQGMQQGMQQGIQETKVQMVHSMLKNGLSYEQIHAYTQMSEHELRALMRDTDNAVDSLD